MSPVSSSFRPLSLAGWVLVSLIFVSAASAQWKTEHFDLKAGYNAIWLTVDCSDRAIDDLLSGNSEVIEIWQWNVDASSSRFTASPIAPDQPDSQWKVWKRGLPSETTLSLLTANAAYLVRVADGAPDMTLPLKGKPVAPRYQWKSSGVNFVGFPMLASEDTSFTEFLSYSSVLKQAPPVFYYNGGDLASNPRRLVIPDATSVERGKAYWVQVNDYTDFYGPLKISALNGEGVEYGSKLNSATIRVKNVADPVKNKTLTATFSLLDSEAAPGESSVEAAVSLRVRGSLDANLQFTYESLPATITLAPGEEVDVVFDANRADMAVTGKRYESVLRITDSLLHTQVDLPVSAIGSSKSGVWVGGAIINSVNRVETLSGPETDAPLGTPDGEGAEETSSVISTVTIAEGVRSETLVFESSFDVEGRAFLNDGALLESNVVVTHPSGSPTFVLGPDYSVVSSNQGIVTHAGSGYSVAPAVTISGGGGTGARADASLSAAVKGVSITSGGSGYTTAPVVTFTGDGKDAAGVAIINGGLVTDIAITNGGSGYSVPPEIEISGGGGEDAAATALIVGGVGGLSITDAGLGYTGIPQVTFTPLNEGGSGARATVKVSEEKVIGVDIVEKTVTVTNGGTGYTAAPTVSFGGGGGTGASATAVLSAGVSTITVTDGGSGYASAPTVTITGDGSGASATAVVTTGSVTEIVVTNTGSGYSTTPTVELTGGEGTGAAAIAGVSGTVDSVGNITVVNGGQDYTSAPDVIFTPVDGNGSGAVAIAQIAGGAVTAVEVIDLVELGSIGDKARFSVTSVSEAYLGEVESTTSSTVISTSKLITLNGKSHLSTKRISTGGAAAAPSHFPVRLILHSPPSGTPSTLVQQLYLGERGGVAYAGLDEDVLSAWVTAPSELPAGNLARVSSASFPLGGNWPGSGLFGGTIEFTVTLGYDAETNPFVHTYHPDHDNWDARYEKKLPKGMESYEVTRKITLTFSPTPPPGVTDLTWGVTTLGGTYSEIISGLRSEEIGISGNFVIQQVSEVSALTTANP
ncbi:hypothetical protein VDG1235_453 [Verrucomicrobiia bacterium DG1235]|nr:hypothetical protein VDG1235_453 [Verrucomicrobiae bacterium DG1235]